MQRQAHGRWGSRITLKDHQRRLEKNSLAGCEGISLSSLHAAESYPAEIWIRLAGGLSLPGGVIVGCTS
jgi:hypothetical protein